MKIFSKTLIIIGLASMLIFTFLVFLSRYIEVVLEFHGLI